jgi:hypothetical protein
VAQVRLRLALPVAVQVVALPLVMPLKTVV